jgi:two-component system nitrate/nitrite response regulator NarL
MTRPEKQNPSSQPLVVIASPSPEIRSRWKRGIGGTFPVHEVGRQADLERAMTRLGPEILLLDINLSRPAGIAGVPAVQRLSPPTKIVLLTSVPNDREGMVALKAGARGYCSKSIAPSLLRRALDSIQKGEIWIGRTLVPRLLEELTSLTERHEGASPASADSRLERLTQRELGIARLIGGGARNKEIATQLNITDRTVKAHVTTIFRKLGFSDRLRLALFVVNESVKSARTQEAASDPPKA